jgi:hypothetical protein
MALKVTRVDTWAASIKDRPGGLAAKLETLAKAGANLEFVVARRSPDRPGTGVVFVAPIKGARATRAARLAGFKTAKALHTVRAEGPDRPGLGAKITGAIACAALNLRGLSAAAIGKRCVVYLAFDTDAAAAKAVRIVKTVR